MMRQIVPPRAVALNVAAAYGQIGLLLELAEEARAAGRNEDALIAKIDALVNQILDTFAPPRVRQGVLA